MTRLPCAVLGAALASAAAASSYIPAAGLRGSPYAPFAHTHWVWLDNSRSNQSAILDYVASYQAYNITVGAIDVDSGWSLGFNDFRVDPSKFPDFNGFVSGLHAEGIRVILWATSMVDTDSSNFAAANSSGYFIKNGFGEQALMTWWHGTGGLLDYTNPEAVSWWNAQLDNVLQLPNGQGIDGWKNDGTDPYIIELLDPSASTGPITYHQYADLYYGGFFNYSRSVNPDALIWSRPVDALTLLSGLNVSLFLDYSPHYVMTSGWVGDQDPTFAGLQAAAINILESGWSGYANFGSDTAGYRSGSTRTAELLLRWAQLNAFLPLFENGGNDEHRPWMYDEPGSTLVTDAYRRLVAAHLELVPYLLTTGTEALEAGNVSSITPVSPPPVDFPFMVQPNQVKDWSYFLGPAAAPDLYLSPVLFPNVTTMQVTVPSNTSGPGAGALGWSSYWAPTQTFAPGETVLLPTPVTVNVALVRLGSVLPLHVSSPLGLVPAGSHAWAPAVTLLLQLPDLASLAALPADAEGAVWRTERRMRDRGNGGLIATASLLTGAGSTFSTAGSLRLRVAVSAYERPVIVLLRTPGGAEALVPAAASLTSGAGSRALQREDALLASPPGGTPASLEWEGTGPSPRYPVGDVHSRLRAAFEEGLADTWAQVGAAGPHPSPALAGLVETAAFVGAQDAATGFMLELAMAAA